MLEARLIAGAVLLACAALGFAFWSHHERAVGAAAVQSKWDAQKATDTAAVLAEVQRQAKVDSEAAYEAQRLSNLSRASASRAADSAGRLQQRVAVLTGSYTQNSLASGSTATHSTGVVLEGVLARVTDAARQFAEYADSARIAGEACVQSSR